MNSLFKIKLMKIKYGLTAGLALVLFSTGFGQEVLNTTGGHIASANLQIEYAIGETAVASFENGGLWITEGVLQPGLTTVTASEETSENPYCFKVFPNPVADLLYIETDSPEFDALELYNEAGQLVQSEHWNGRYLDMRRYAAGIYMLELKSGTLTIQTFKIIKP